MEKKKVGRPLGRKDDPSTPRKKRTDKVKTGINTAVVRAPKQSLDLINLIKNAPKDIIQQIVIFAKNLLSHEKQRIERNK
jgi:hypothetical protein